MKFRTVPGLLICSISLSAALAADKVETVPLKIELPKPVYIVTPTTITPDFPVEPLPKKPVARPLINVPKGTELLSLKKKVTSSEDSPILGELTMVTDGDKEKDKYVELTPGHAVITPDGGTSKIDVTPGVTNVVGVLKVNGVVVTVP